MLIGYSRNNNGVSEAPYCFHYDNKLEEQHSYIVISKRS